MRLLIKPRKKKSIEVNWPTEKEDELSFLAVAQLAVNHHDKGGSGLIMHLTNHEGEIMLPYADGKVDSSRIKKK